MSRIPGALALVVVAGCAPQYAYVPTTNATATIQGRVAAEYPIPPTAPQGDVRVASYGLTDVTPKSAPKEILRALHLRLALADSGATPWTFDTRDQRVALETGEVIAPAFASANAGAPPPLVTIDRNGKRVVDLFFILPAGFQHADAIPEFDAMWRVSTGAGVIAERTPFERLTVEPDTGEYDAWDYGGDYYWGGGYWTNPDFGSVGYRDGSLDGGVVIRRSPRFWHSGAGREGAGRGGFHGGAGGHGGPDRGGGHR